MTEPVNMLELSDADVSAIVAGADEDLSSEDMHLLLRVTAAFRAHGDLLDALAAVRGKLRRAIRESIHANALEVLKAAPPPRLEPGPPPGT